MKLYLWLNAFSYVLFAGLCIYNPAGIASYLGYNFLNNSGKAEFAAVYIGMQISFAVFFGICSYYQRLNLAGLLLAVCIYIGLIITRTFFALYVGNVANVTYLVGSSEYLLGAWGLILLVKELKHQPIINENNYKSI